MGVNRWIWEVWVMGRDSLIDIQDRWSVDDVVRAHVIMAIEGEVKSPGSPDAGSP